MNLLKYYRSDPLLSEKGLATMNKRLIASLAYFAMLAPICVSPAFAASQLCRGQIVYGNNGNNLVGQVQEIFGEKIEIRWTELNGEPFNGNLAYWNISDLSAETNCTSKNICTGNLVYGSNGNNLVGIAKRVFENGKVEVQWTEENGNSFRGPLAYWEASDLFNQTGSLGQIYEGVTVYGSNGNNLVGTVQKVFGNGKVEVRWNELNGQPFRGDLGYWEANDLSIEVRCSGAICAGDSVFGSNGNNLVGTAEKVFKNGKVEVRWNELNGQPFRGDLGYWESSQLQKLSTRCGEHSCH